MLKYAGHFQWQAIAAAAGMPLSTLRTTSGGEVYASFYYIEIVIPDAAPLESFRLDDTVRFVIALRSFKNIAFEGRADTSIGRSSWAMRRRRSASRTSSSRRRKATAGCASRRRRRRTSPSCRRCRTRRTRTT